MVPFEQSLEGGRVTEAVPSLVSIWNVHAEFQCHCRSVVMVPDPKMSKADTAAADEVLDSLKAFRPEQWGLPPFDDAEC